MSAFTDAARWQDIQRQKQRKYLNGDSQHWRVVNNRNPFWDDSSSDVLDLSADDYREVTPPPDLPSKASP